MFNMTVKAKIQGTSPYTYGAPVANSKLTGEPSDDYEKRTWRQRARIDADGNAFIPPMALKNCLDSIAQYLSESVPGKGSAKFTKHFVSGVQVFQPMVMHDQRGKPIKGDDLREYPMFVPSDGKRGGGTRVWRSYPLAEAGWTIDAEIVILDPVIDENRIREYLLKAGLYIGLGSFRPQNRGYHGRFAVTEFSAHKQSD